MTAEETDRCKDEDKKSLKKLANCTLEGLEKSTLCRDTNLSESNDKNRQN